MAQAPKAKANPANIPPSTAHTPSHTPSSGPSPNSKKSSRNKKNNQKAYVPKSTLTLPATNLNNAPPPPSPAPPLPPSHTPPYHPFNHPFHHYHPPQPHFPQVPLHQPLPPFPSPLPPQPPLYHPPPHHYQPPHARQYYHASHPPMMHPPTTPHHTATPHYAHTTTSSSPSPSPSVTPYPPSSFVSPYPPSSSSPSPSPSPSSAPSSAPRQTALPDPPRFGTGYRGPPRKSHKKSARPQAGTATTVAELIKIEISRNFQSDADRADAGDTTNSTPRLSEELVGENPDIMKEVIPPAAIEEEPIIQCECGAKFEKKPTEKTMAEHVRTRSHKFGMKLIAAQTSVEVEARQIQPEQVLKAGEAITPAIVKFFEQVRPSREDQEQRQDLCTWLERHIRKIYPDASVLLFGSSACNLYFKNSDIDLCALLGENAHQHNQWSGADLEKTAIIRIAKRLHMEGIHDITKVLHSRVPILKKNTAQTTGFAFDLCVDRPLGLFNSNLISYYMTLDSRVPPLLFVLKKWSKCVGINDSQRGRLSSYCINCMLIYFLQTRVPAVLPNLQANPLSPVMVYGYDCAFERHRAFKSKNNSPMGVLLMEFFHFYGFLFDFEHDAVSIKMAQDPPPKKSVFQWNAPMCVQDPFETDFNLSRNVTKPILLEILFQFQTAYIDVCNMQDLSLLWELAE